MYDEFGYYTVKGNIGMCVQAIIHLNYNARRIWILKKVCFRSIEFNYDTFKNIDHFCLI